MDKFEMVKRFVNRENEARTGSVNKYDNYATGYVNGIRSVIRFIDAIDQEES